MTAWAWNYSRWLARQCGFKCCKISHRREIPQGFGRYMHRRRCDQRYQREERKGFTTLIILPLAMLGSLKKNILNHTYKNVTFQKQKLTRFHLGTRTPGKIHKAEPSARWYVQRRFSLLCAFKGGSALRLQSVHEAIPRLRWASDCRHKKAVENQRWHLRAPTRTKQAREKQ